MANAEYMRSYRKQNPEAAYRPIQQWCENNRERSNEIKRRYREKNREWERLCAVLKIHDLTLDQYHALQESQDFCCAICGDEVPLHVDHNHDTGKIRALLCHGCNAAIGLLKESPERCTSARAYLEHHNG